MIQPMVVTYCRAGGIDLERSRNAALWDAGTLSNMALITGLLEGEPVVVLRGADPFAHEALARYADSVATTALPEDLARLRAVLDQLDAWQATHQTLLAEVRREGTVR